MKMYCNPKSIFIDMLFIAIGILILSGILDIPFNNFILSYLFIRLCSLSYDVAKLELMHSNIMKPKLTANEVINKSIDINGLLLNDLDKKELIEILETTLKIQKEYIEELKMEVKDDNEKETK